MPSPADPGMGSVTLVGIRRRWRSLHRERIAVSKYTLIVSLLVFSYYRQANSEAFRRGSTATGDNETKRQEFSHEKKTIAHSGAGM